MPAEFNQMGTQNGIPYQEGRSCSYDFQKLFRDVDPKLLGFRQQQRARAIRSNGPA